VTRILKCDNLASIRDKLETHQTCDNAREQPGLDAGRGVDDIEAELSVPNIVVTLVVVVAAVAGDNKITSFKF